MLDLRLTVGYLDQKHLPLTSHLTMQSTFCPIYLIKKKQCFFSYINLYKLFPKLYSSILLCTSHQELHTNSLYQRWLKGRWKTRESKKQCHQHSSSGKWKTHTFSFGKWKRSAEHNSDMSEFGIWFCDRFKMAKRGKCRRIETSALGGIRPW